MNDDDLWLDAALDDELDAAASLALQRRLDADPALRARWQARGALRDALRAPAGRHAAPAGLRERVAAALGLADDVAVARRPARAARPWGYAVGGAVAAALATWLVLDLRDALKAGGPVVAGGQGATGGADAAGATGAGAAEAAEAVSAHTRALLVDHPIEVASADQHTVRPWLSARLNFVPPVADYAPQGYALLGARRDVLAGETAAALVYRHGAHVISVFVRPAPASQPPVDGAPLVVRGFNVLRRTHAGMAFCLVSDLNPRELAALADLLVAPGAPPAAP